MATITTSAAGAVNVGSNWVGGSVPGITDDAVIAHAMTVPTGYTFKPSSITTTLTSGNAITVQGTGQIGDATDRVALTIARGFYGNLIYKNSVGPLLVYAKDIHFICGSVSATGTACIASVGTTCYDGVIVDAAGFDVYVKRENDAGLGKGYVALSTVGNFSQAVATLICKALTLVNVGNDRDDELYGVAAISTGVSSAVAKLTAEEVYLSVDDGATGARGAETYAIYSQSSINAISEIDISDYYYQAANSDTGPWVTLASSEAGNAYGEIIFRRGFTIHENSVCILDCFQGTNADGSGKVYGDNESTPHTITNYGDLLVLCPDYLTDFRVVNVTSQAQAAMTCPLNLRDNVTVVPYVGTVVATPAEIEAYVQAALTSQGLTTTRAVKLDNSDVATSTLATPASVLTQSQAALTAQGYAMHIVASTTGNWSTAGTWTGGAAPAAGQNVVIADGVTVTISAPVDLASLGTLTLRGSGKLVIAEGVTVATLPRGWIVDTNNGTITTNLGEVYSNQGTITTNRGRVVINTEDGTVGYHSTGVVEQNEGTITTSYSDVMINAAAGVIASNYHHVQINRGTVTTNTASGVVGNAGGTVTANTGKLYEIDAADAFVGADIDSTGETPLTAAKALEVLTSILCGKSVYNTATGVFTVYAIGDDETEIFTCTCSTTIPGNRAAGGTIS